MRVCKWEVVARICINISAFGSSCRCTLMFESYPRPLIYPNVIHHPAKRSDDDRNICSCLKCFFEHYPSMVQCCIVHFIVGQKSGILSAMCVQNGGTKVHVSAPWGGICKIRCSGDHSRTLWILTAREKFIWHKLWGTKACDNGRILL